MVISCSSRALQYRLIRSHIDLKVKAKTDFATKTIAIPTVLCAVTYIHSMMFSVVVNTEHAPAHNTTAGFPNEQCCCSVGIAMTKSADNGRWERLVFQNITQH